MNYALSFGICSMYSCMLCMCLCMCVTACASIAQVISGGSAGRDSENVLKSINQTATGKVQASTVQRCSDHTEAAGQWRGRSSLPQQTPPGTVFLRRDTEKERLDFTIVLFCLFVAADQK